jgi:hypothetical protein
MEFFFANLTNTSNFKVTIWQYPMAGGRHSPITLKPSLRIENQSNEEVAVKLKVKGDPVCLWAMINRCVKKNKHY